MAGTNLSMAIPTKKAPIAAGRAFVSIGGLSRATGVPIETLRTWELRYGFPRSVRKPSGHRQFEVAQVERIRRMAMALERGLRAGEVVPASDAVLERHGHATDPLHLGHFELAVPRRISH